jgi:uncharacterized membrane protein SirB2
MSDFFANWITGIPMMIAIVVLITLTVIELRKKRAKQREFKLFLEFKEAWGCNYEEFKAIQKVIIEEHNKKEKENV